MKLVANFKEPPLASLITSQLLRPVDKIDIEWIPDSTSSSGSKSFDSDVSLCRYLAEYFNSSKLYGVSPIDRVEVDHWLTFSIGPLQNLANLQQHLVYLDREISTVTYLVGEEISIADIVLWTQLFKHDIKNTARKQFCSVYRWYSFIESQNSVQESLCNLPANVRDVISKNKAQQVVSESSSTEKRDEGKFIELPGAEMGKVVVRFPPEASGYLHIGHAKAALLNQHYKDKFAGKLVMRFDDTNPAKEKVDFEKVILEDLEMLQVKPDIFTHTSDYFDLMLEYCEKLLKENRAYVDDTDPEVMKNEREKRVESKHRNNAVAVNFKMWKEMLDGTDYGKKCCVRAKIDMNSANGCMRDPTIYRCKPETHPKTGNKYKVYPTYDFACPIVDSIEGVTHCLRTTEYHDRDDQFYWFIDALGLRKPYIWEYSRLNMTNTVLSKRKLTWFVEEGLVDGWDDPRFPTVRGILRRGMTVAGLTQFIIAQGSSRSVVSMEWDKIWAFNKKVIDPIAPRYTALESTGTVPVLVEGVKTEKVQVPKHPKNEEVGLKWIWRSDRILIDNMDAADLKENENATFINWGNLLITKINRGESKTITSIHAKENISNTDFKKTLKLTWLSDIAEAPFVPCVCVYFDHIITKPILSKDEDFKNFINPHTRIEKIMLGDPELSNVKKGDIIQLQRRGFYICDQEYQPARSLNDFHFASGESKEEAIQIAQYLAFGLYSSNAVPIILFFIPDGHTKETAITVQSIKNSKDDGVKKETKAASEETSKKKVDKQKNKKVTTATTTPASAPEPKSLVSDPKTIEELTKLLDSIRNQGDIVRRLKADKAEKLEVDNEVNTLKKLKESFKALSKIEWKPGLTIDQIAVSTPSSSTSALNGEASSGDDLYQRVCLQTSKYKFMQLKKVDKNRINTEVTLLADLKEQYKSSTGKEWALREGHNIDNLYDQHISRLYEDCVAQGDKVRQLKTQKADVSAVNAEVKKLLELKAKYKEASGLDYKPPDPKAVSGASVSASTSASASASASAAGAMSKEALELHEKIVEQGNKVRTVKAEKSAKEVIDSEVKILLSLKAEFKKASGTDWTPKLNIQDGKVAGAPEKPVEKPAAKKKNQPEAAQVKKAAESAASSSKKQTRLGLEAKKDENLSDWYTQVITKSELIDYYDVSGCYILRPWAFAIWKAIRSWFEQEICKLGVDECYFPIFVSRAALEKEKTHIADFAPEVAWVTKSGESDLEEPVAIRPTSETVMYPAYAKWIRSHRDLPLKLNQWNNVVRWEFKHPQPFLRTREFLWQEGHTAYATREEAEQEVYVILDLYAKIYTDLLAIPVIKGRKTEKEKFAGGDFTTTVEAFISASGRGIQGGTSHHLGQNFSKMFDIVFEDPKTQEKQFVFQNSWGLTTRTIGVMIMVHADDQGLVLPPRVAKIQVVIIPCGISGNMKNEDRQSLENSCSELESTLLRADVKVLYDGRDNYTTGWKFNDWELKGVPLRLELGPKDIKQNQVVAVRRDTGEKLVLNRNSIVTDVKNTLDQIQQSLFDKADKDLKDHTVVCEDWSLFAKKLNEKNIILSPFCGDMDCEDKIKQESARSESADPGAPSMGAKSLCIPFDQPKAVSPTTLCIHPDCRKPAKFYTLFGRSY